MTKMRTIGLLAGLVVVLAACSPSASPTDGSPSEAASMEPSMAASGAPSESGAALRIVETSAGSALAGPDGLTLYIHTEEGTGSFVCTEGCLENWPPLTGDIAAGEANAELLATVTRPDGIEQWTYNGFPLYYFAGDAAEGEATGQGLNGVWFIADPAGN